MDELGKCYQKDSSIVSRVVEDEVILVPIRQSVGDLESIYTLNEVGARIWDLIDGKKNVKQIAGQIVQEFDVSSKQSKEDALNFVHQLQEVGAVSENLCKD